MTQKNFLTALQKNKQIQSKLKKAAQQSDGAFYFELGSLFNRFNVIGWESDTFIDKVCEICEIEF